jgi:hypothetical protein
MRDAGSFGGQHGGAQRQQIIELGRQEVPAVHLHDDQPNPFGFQLAVTEPRRAEHLHTSLLEVTEVIRVVHASLRVRFLITHAYRNLVMLQHEGEGLLLLPHPSPR